MFHCAKGNVPIDMEAHRRYLNFLKEAKTATAVEDSDSDCSEMDEESTNDTPLPRLKIELSILEKEDTKKMLKNMNLKYAKIFNAPVETNVKVSQADFANAIMEDSGQVSGKLAKFSFDTASDSGESSDTQRDEDVDDFTPAKKGALPNWDHFVQEEEKVEVKPTKKLEGTPKRKFTSQAIKQKQLIF